MEPIAKTLDQKLAELRANHPKTSRPIPKQKSLGDPNCQDCHGLGYTSVPNPEWRTNGKPINDLIPCSCRLENELGRLSGLEGKELELTWNDIQEIDNVNDGMKALKDTINKGYGMVYLYGGAGNAKTMLLKIAVAQMVKLCKEANYTKMSNILDNMRAAYDTDYPQAESISRMNRWSEIPFLCIDEMDKIRGTEYEKERRFELLDNRYTDSIREKTITLMAGNVAPEELGNEYLSSRVRDKHNKVVHLTGGDMRPVELW